MRVLQLSKFYPPVMGGIEAVAWELTEGLNRAGVATDVLCSAQRPRSSTAVLPLGYTVTRAASWGRILSTSMAPAMLPALSALARDRDIVHVHMPDPMAALAVWGTRPSARIVVHWHSDVIRQRKALLLYEPLQHWLLERADAVIATSEPYVQASHVLRAWRSKVSVIPIGIRDNRPVGGSRTAAAIRQRLGQRRMVFALGRMTYYKGFEVLIEAALRLSDDCVVVIGGDGELLDHYRRLVDRHGLSQKVHLLGHVKDRELADYFEACDVFCMPSTLRAEAYGVAIVEAMVMGKPIVASDITGSGVPWVNRDGVTGLNVPVSDPDALASALTRLLNDELLRRRLGAAARRRYETEFNAALMTERTLAVYERLVYAARRESRP